MPNLVIVKVCALPSARSSSRYIFISVVLMSAGSGVTAVGLWLLLEEVDAWFPVSESAALWDSGLSPCHRLLNALHFS